MFYFLEPNVTQSADEIWWHNVVELLLNKTVNLELNNNILDCAAIALPGNYECFHGDHLP